MRWGLIGCLVSSTLGSLLSQLPGWGGLVLSTLGHGIQHSVGQGGAVGCRVVTVKKQREDVGHEAELGEEEGENHDSRFSIVKPLITG